MGCWFGHKWKARGVTQLAKITRGGGYKPVVCPVTEVLLVCGKCEQSKTICLDGQWTFEQLVGETSDDDFLNKMRVSI